jgi:hypothetical protein
VLAACQVLGERVPLLRCRHVDCFAVFTGALPALGCRGGGRGRGGGIDGV